VVRQRDQRIRIGAARDPGQAVVERLEGQVLEHLERDHGVEAQPGRQRAVEVTHIGQIVRLAAVIDVRRAHVDALVREIAAIQPGAAADLEDAARPRAEAQGVPDLVPVRGPALLVVIVLEAVVRRRDLDLRRRPDHEFVPGAVHAPW